MANDATGKATVTSESSEGNVLPNTADQQKVPPLRIVLNTSSNQKSSTAALSAQQTHTKKEKAQDVKSESVKVGGRVRIKLGTNRQPSKQNSSKATNEINNHKTKASITNEKLVEVNEDSTSSFGHLRRITRRSQRAVQPISNEDEESISSMTSTDENQITNNQLNSDIAIQESEHSNPANTSSNPANAASTTATNGSNTDAPRRYKRRKVETNESQSNDCDSLLGLQNYKLPNQNSFELFKNIRKQVDKKLRNLSNVHPKVPYGFRDYMLSRGAYLLDGNKLGNGTNLFMNEDGGLNPAPLGKYHAIRKDRINYSVPDRAKVPLGLPVNSPLYDLFVEQEKERYRMRMQHIKEREKLTLSAEQEIIRVYNQAARLAADQTEPLSACTMLKHQEIYNYMDSDGVTILSREDAQQDQVKPDGVRTRRRQHGHISPSSGSRKNSDVEDANTADALRKKDEEPSVSGNAERVTNEESTNSPEASKEFTSPKEDFGSPREKDESVKEEKSAEKESGLIGEKIITPNQLDNQEKREPDLDEQADSVTKTLNIDAPETVRQLSEPDKSENIKDDSPDPDIDKKTKSLTDIPSKIELEGAQPATNLETLSETNRETDANELREPPDQNAISSISFSQDDSRIQGKETFLSHLQEIDDKWDRIRQETLVRHKNESESLYAIQKLEWEWKTKEIGACDVRTNPVIDDTLVPRLNIYSQDY